MPPLRIAGRFKLFRFNNEKSNIYSLAISCDQEKEKFFENL